MLPELKKIPYKNESHIISFGGLNRQKSRQDGEMLDMTNLTSDYAPYLSTRKGREVFKNLSDVSYIGSHGNHFFYVKGTEFYIDDVKKGDVTAGEKQIEVMNDYIVIFPDKKMYDIVNDTFKAMQIDLECSNILFETDRMIIGGASPKGQFEVGDAIKIVGGTYDDKKVIIKEMPQDNVIVIGPNTFTEGINETNLGLIREVPDMEFIVEHENRLWGCKGNEIYASRQGSCVNFNVFAGLSSDSYAADVGTAGPFTAAINYNNNLLFFKENCIHKVFGNKPSNYQLITQHTEGVAKGYHHSTAIAGGMLYYRTPKHFVSYNGSIPDIIDDKLGDKVYNKAVVGTDGYKLYCSMQDELLVFDTLKNVWHKEDQTDFIGFTLYKGELIGNTGKALIKMVSEQKERLPFMAVLGPFNERGTYGEQQRTKKGYSKLNIELELGINSECHVMINHDGGEYKHLATLRGLEKYHRLLVQPKRCNEFTIKIMGIGECQVASIGRTYRIRGDA